jgi:ubiquinone biosynthesis protein COQ4
MCVVHVRVCACVPCMCVCVCACASHARVCCVWVGARILRERPIVTSASIDVPRLLQLPPDTLGRRYAEFMSGHGFEADGRPGVEHIANEDAAYVMLRYRQCHDFYHALTGLPISILGELGQKAFEYRCTGLPVGMLAVLGGSVRLSSQQRRVLVEQLLPWALTQRLTVPLLCVYWEELLHVPVPVLRVRLGMLPPPDLALL